MSKQHVLRYINSLFSNVINDSVVYERLPITVAPRA
jgi:hypothetical protein